MYSDMKITLAQINPIVGDISGNLRKIADTTVSAAAAYTPDLIVFPELCLTGYPPKDLVERPAFVEQAAAALKSIEELSASCAGVGIVVGLPMASRGGGKGVVNAAALVAGGRTLHRQFKSLLPTYDVFDEARYFDTADSIEPADFKGEKLGLSICEDAWNDPELFGRRRYDIDPVAILAQGGATIMINISASPFSEGKEALRLELMRRHATQFGTPFIMVNQVGGNDELVFDGRSYFVDAAGHLRAALPMFEEAVSTVDTNATSGAPLAFQPMDETECVYRALVLGTRDYIHKCGFERAIVGLSGGIDSAVTLTIAARALGGENVRAITMPSPHSSKGSVEDSRALADNLGVRLDVIEIGDIMASYDRALEGAFGGQAAGVTEENIQARIRGNILMAHSNKFGCLVLATGNKSELAVGYCTLYGDMSGGLAVISDVPKMMVYRLADRINRDAEVIPRAIIEKAPSAELKPGQKDQDTLPPYDILDAILDLYIEEGLSGPAIVERGYDRDTVAWVLEAVRSNEYKRKQAPPGLKVTSKAFGIGRRFPIAARYDV
jgi:NAD+ synthase (glutamine-hydrolysing)